MAEPLDFFAGLSRFRRLRVATTLPLIATLLVAGCGRQDREVAEGLSLARLLRRLAPEADDLVGREREIANQLRINLDQSGGDDFARFSNDLSMSVSDLTAITTRLAELRQQVHDGNFEAPLVLVVQRDAVAEFQNQINQIDGFVTLAKNIELRASLGRTKGFPEVDTLIHQLVLFLSQPHEDALSSQVQTLKNEYRFTDNQIGT
ncbi:MAG TPA: hypothetical protein VHY84_27690 [Bryobacteraceae bacterium]|jgi:hypothetical protein|nr:hypothetical protein [Bryobacteraceae bacterium]